MALAKFECGQDREIIGGLLRSAQHRQIQFRYEREAELMQCHSEHIAGDEFDQRLPLVGREMPVAVVAREKARLLLNLRLERLPSFKGWNGWRRGLHSEGLGKRGLYRQSDHHQQRTEPRPKFQQSKSTPQDEHCGIVLCDPSAANSGCQNLTLANARTLAPGISTSS